MGSESESRSVNVNNHNTWKKCSPRHSLVVSPREKPFSVMELAHRENLLPSLITVLRLIYIAGSGLGLGFRLQTLWLHSIIQNFSHWFRSGSLLRWFSKWLLYPFWDRSLSLLHTFQSEDQSMNLNQCEISA